MSDARFPDRIVAIDSHTEGEPTRCVVDGWPALRGATMAERREDFARRFDQLRAAVVLEPRGHDALVGALLTPPVSDGAAAGVIFFNNVGCLGMCGHGLIGVVRTLEFLGRVEPGAVRVDTPAGVVDAQLDADGSVTFRNVAARVHALDVPVDVPELGRVTGDVAYGGNWFFITHVPGVALELSRLDELMHATSAIQRALDEAGIVGADGARIDHVELAVDEEDGATVFVLCPGGEYDRSPCGTGTSAKLAVLAARGRLGPGETWRQRSVTGGEFTAWYEEADGDVVPRVRGRAWVTAELVLRFDAADPLRGGFSART